MITAETSPMLAGLIAQAADEGADLLTLRALVEEASELGATRALKRMGLHEGVALTDIADLRQFVAGWRDARRTVRNACIAWAVRGALAVLAMTLALKLGFGNLFGI